MLLQELKEQAYKLSTGDRLDLIATLIQSLQSQVEIEDWQYLAKRNHPWRKQLYIKGRKLLASTVWQDAIANKMSREEAAANWDLPIDAIAEVFRYCQSHQNLLKLEADEAYYRLVSKGASFESKVAA